MAEVFINADTGDNGTGDGSTGTPWETLAYAYDNSSTGDTITCQDSTASYAFVTDSITDRTIRGLSDDASGAVFDGAGTAATWTMGGDTSLSKITLTNVVEVDADPNRILYFTTSVSQTHTVDSCIFHTISMAGSSDQTCGLICKNGSGVSASITVTSCLFYDIIKSGGNPQMFGFRDFEGTLTFNNNSFWTNETGSSTLPRFFTGYSGAFTLNLNNNIFMAEGDAMVFGSNMHLLTINSTSNCYNNVTSPPSGTNDITSDPLFVDGPNNDYRLRQASPCIDTGILV